MKDIYLIVYETDAYECAPYKFATTEEKAEQYRKECEQGKGWTHAYVVKLAEGQEFPDIIM